MWPLSSSGWGGGKALVKKNVASLRYCLPFLDIYFLRPFPIKDINLRESNFSEDVTINLQMKAYL